MIIKADQIRREFQTPRKKEGWPGVLQLLMRPEVETREALKGVSFEIEAGSFVGLIGANGAGKTTLLKILSGLIPPSSGKAQVLGYKPFDRPREFRKKIALVMGQKAQLWWDLPAIDAFDLIRAIYQIPTPDYQSRLKELTELLDVGGLLNTQIRRLSLGERMKMELIGAILHWPEVIFLDEPTIGLDVFAAHKLREFLKVFNQKHKATLILTSHNMDDIERLCSRVLILRSGSLIYDGKPDGLTQQGARSLRVHLKERPSLEELAQHTQLPVSKISVDRSEEDVEGKTTFLFQLEQDQMVGVLQAILARFQVMDMGIEEPSLESVIQRIYSEEKGSVL